MVSKKGCRKIRVFRCAGWLMPLNRLFLANNKLHPVSHKVLTRCSQEQKNTCERRSLKSEWSGECHFIDTVAPLKSPARLYIVSNLKLGLHNWVRYMGVVAGTVSVKVYLPASERASHFQPGCILVWRG